MSLETLKRPFIGITVSDEDFIKVKGLLPTPSYKATLYGHNYRKTILIYLIDGYITSPAQFRWLSSIKLGLCDYLYIPFDFVEEFTVDDHTEITTALYTIKELSQAFNAPLVEYPKIMYPSDKKELYRRLCWYGKRLVHQRLFTKEAMIAAALQMNKSLPHKYSTKELHKKALGAYMFIHEQIDSLPKRLDSAALKKARSKGGQVRRDQRVNQTRQKIDELLKRPDFYKPNGKPNISLIAKTLNIHRNTVTKYVSS